MRKAISSLLIMSLFCLIYPTTSEGVGRHVHSPQFKKSEAYVDMKILTSKEALKSKKKEARRFKRLEKLNKRLDRKLQKRQLILDDEKFILGLVLLGGALVLGIIIAIGILAGLLSFIAVIATLAGLGLIIWSLIEHLA